MGQANSTNKLRIGLIRGDGIGPELTDASREVLDAALFGREVEYFFEDGGADTFVRTGQNLSPEALERIRGYHATLKAPVGLPGVRRPDGTEAGVLGGVLRGGLDAWANIRPVRSIAGVNTPLGPNRRIDYVIVRENTEGLYLSRGLGVVTQDAACDQLMVTRRGCERVIRRAFELASVRSGAVADGARRVTCVDKSNVLRSFAFFRAVFDEVATQYPEIEADYRYPDAAGHDLVVDPEHFDVLVMENFVGDILSDVGAATVGGLGMCPGGNVGDGGAYFEPIHGSAPSLAGTDRANPTSQILAAAMLLDHVGEPDRAEAVRWAVDTAFGVEMIRLDGRGRPDVGTRGVARIIAELVAERL